MRSLAGSAAFAVLLVCSPLSAQEAAEQPAAPATQTVDAPVQATKEAAAAASDAVATPPAAPELTPASPPPPPPPITLVLNTDLGAQRLTVIENGKAKYAWPISSGRRGFATPTGTFHPQWASRMHYSRQYEFAPMPHAVFFHRGTAFHGTGAVGLLASRLRTAACAWHRATRRFYSSLCISTVTPRPKSSCTAASRSKEPAVARRRSRGELASARASQHRNYRVSRASVRRSAHLGRLEARIQSIT